MLLVSNELNQSNVEDEERKKKHKTENIEESKIKANKHYDVAPISPTPHKVTKKEAPKKQIYYPKYSPKEETEDITKKEIKKKSIPIRHSMVQPSYNLTAKDENIDVQLIYRRHSMPIRRDGVRINSKSNPASPEITNPQAKKTGISHSQPVSPQPLSPKTRILNKQQQQRKQQQLTQKRKRSCDSILLTGFGFISLLLICLIILAYYFFIDAHN